MVRKKPRDTSGRILVAWFYFVKYYALTLPSHHDYLLSLSLQLLLDDLTFVVRQFHLRCEEPDC